MTIPRIRHALSAARERVVRPLGLLLFFAYAAYASRDRAPSPEEVRGLAGDAEVQRRRTEAESRLRAVVDAYAEQTPLGLGLVRVSDRCVGGVARELFEQTGRDEYRIRCEMRVTAYYGADPRRVGDVLDGILDAGDRYASVETGDATIPFRHRNQYGLLVDYYRGTGPGPNGPNGPEPCMLSAPDQTLSWDAVRGIGSRRTLVDEEPDCCTESDPPLVRCLREPEARSVADIRRQCGMVFKLELSTVMYHRVPRGRRAARRSRRRAERSRRSGG
ncbi:hypothetical protein GCM10010331_66800 [Streptomyces xanthochromogenes]|uniref:hypothetical protein n=1 Tax=Streptomyces xanthochromogenes TaxID=67384 RepID=UPI001673494B|nr:hypothetical protein [Streptomyces xanthochromogenes]GHB69485.1 hypothetical protein GCM10010331_66800 [Streptomyces xanthochromogenes]